MLFLAHWRMRVHRMQWQHARQHKVIISTYRNRCAADLDPASESESIVATRPYSISPSESVSRENSACARCLRCLRYRSLIAFLFTAFVTTTTVLQFFERRCYLFTNSLCQMHCHANDRRDVTSITPETLRCANLEVNVLRCFDNACNAA